MKNWKKKLATENGKVVLYIILIVILSYAVSWIATCGIIKLITVCFGLNFKWNIATGIWLVLCLIRNVFKVVVKKE